MARFVTGPVVTSASSSATSIGLLRKKFILLTWRLNSNRFRPFLRTMLPNAVAQALGRRYPQVVSLEVDPEDVVMRGRAFDCHLLDPACSVTNQHLRLVGVERRPIDGPVCAVVVSQSFVG